MALFRGGENSATMAEEEAAIHSSWQRRKLRLGVGGQRWLA